MPIAASASTSGSGISSRERTRSAEGKIPTKVPGSAGAADGRGSERAHLALRVDDDLPGGLREALEHHGRLRCFLCTPCLDTPSAPRSPATTNPPWLFGFLEMSVTAAFS
jgi:hypothetical protein